MANLVSIPYVVQLTLGFDERKAETSTAGSFAKCSGMYLCTVTIYTRVLTRAPGPKLSCNPPMDVG